MKWWRNTSVPIILFLIWRVGLFLVEQFAHEFVPIIPWYVGPSPWANFDGAHYLKIATDGYYDYSEAFFPLYPLIIRFIFTFTHLPALTSGLLLSHVAALLLFILIYKFAEEHTKISPFWMLLCLALFPVSFYLVSIYNESLFLLLAVSSVYSAYKKKWVMAGIFGALASATRLFGIFLFPTLLWLYYRESSKKRVRDVVALSLVWVGLLLYMAFLYQRTGDPLKFFHVQPAFGAERSGSSLIFLPQVIYRYLKIFVTADFGTPVYIVSFFEFVTTLLSLLTIIVGWRQKSLRPLLVYAFLVVCTPTLTGTFSSMPRYVLSAFPLLMVVAGIQSNFRKGIITILFACMLCIATAAFLRGYFVS